MNIELKKLLAISITLLMSMSYLYSQRYEDRPKFGILFNGFVKTDAFIDSRQTVSFDDNAHFMLYPAPVSEDKNGEDINSGMNFNILSLQTRLTGEITIPDAFGAKSTGMIEGDFFAFTDEIKISSFRLNNAFVKFNWKNAELMAGQYWHPLFIVQSFPEVFSFNTGAPFKPYATNPQLRYTSKIKSLSLISTIYTLNDFPANGPFGPSTVYKRNSIIPNANFTLTIDDGTSLMGLGVDYKTLVPRIKTDKGYKTNTSVNGIAITAFSKLAFNKVTWKFQKIYSQNAYDISGIGGYAVKFDSYDNITGMCEYTNLNTSSFWTELYYKSFDFLFGIFAGYTYNLGSSEKMELDPENVFARGNDIEYVYRISPRIAFIQKNSTIGFEVEYTVAAYGKHADIDNSGKFLNSTEVANIRGLLTFIHKF